MSAPAAIIKREGKRESEHFQPGKIHASVYAACLSIRTPEGEAEHIAEKVCDAVSAWCAAKSEVTSDDLRRVASTLLETFQPEAAYLYKHHRLVL